MHDKWHKINAVKKKRKDERNFICLKNGEATALLACRPFLIVDGFRSVPPDGFSWCRVKKNFPGSVSLLTHMNVDLPHQSLMVFTLQKTRWYSCCVFFIISCLLCLTRKHMILVARNLLLVVYCCSISNFIDGPFKVFYPFAVCLTRLFLLKRF